MNIFVSILIHTIAIFVVAEILPGVAVKSFVTALIVAVVLGVMNTFVKPLLIFFTLPLTLLTLGLFIFIINALLVLLTDKLVPGFEVQNFWWALLFSFLISLVSSFLNNIARERSK